MKKAHLQKEARFNFFRQTAYQEYKRISGLSSDDMDTWTKINPYVNEWINKRAKELSK